MKTITEKQAIDILKKYAPNKKIFDTVLKHSLKVQEIALRIAKKIPQADMEFIRTASLLHDIGRFKCPPGPLTIKHGIAGAEILRKEKLPKHALVAERHLGAGISKKDIKEQKLKLPLKDHIPKSIEEKIITHADNLVFGAREGTFNEVLERFRKELGEKYTRKFVKLKDDIENMQK